MIEFPDTRASLLVRLRDSQNGEAWEEFTNLYQPVIYRLARGRGMQDADALDLSQHVLLAIAGAIERWKPAEGNGHFRHWLRRVVRNAIINALTRTPVDAAPGGSDAQELLFQQPQPDPLLESQLEFERRREVYHLAAQIVRKEVQPETWQAFQSTVIEGHDVAAVAKRVGKPKGAIYTARSRVMQRLRSAVENLEGKNE